MAWIQVTVVAILCWTTTAMIPLTNTPDVQIEYFTGTNLTCDSIMLNISQRWNEIESMQWMLPDATLLTDSTEDITVHKAQIKFPYTLAMSKVRDKHFGYYTCIIVLTTATVNEVSKVHVVRWGLNIDGPDFSRLRDQYAQNAITGAIAAGVLLGVLGLTCIIFHYKYSSRRSREIEAKYAPNGSTDYHNKAYEEVDIETVKSPEHANGSSTTKTDTSEVNERM